jgi:hypothetical protein
MINGAIAMRTSIKRRDTRLNFALPALVFLLLTALEIADSVGFKVAVASVPVISTHAAACTPQTRAL